jgi:Flp pilus assembly protein TadD
MLIHAQDMVAGGDEALAEQRIREVIGADPGVIDAWTMLGSLCHRQGRAGDAVAAFEEALRRRPDDPLVSAALATALLSAGRGEEARRTLEAAQKIQPEDPRLYYLRGMVAEQESRDEEAAAHYRRALALNTRSAPAHVQLGALALRSDDVATAEREYEHEPADADTPESLFERSWARTVFDHVVERLEQETARHEGAERVARLRPFLTGAEPRDSCADIAREWGVGESAVRVAVHRLRKRFAALLREEVGRTVADEKDVDDEIRYLLALVP